MYPPKFFPAFKKVTNGLIEVKPVLKNNYRVKLQCGLGMHSSQNEGCVIVVPLEIELSAAQEENRRLKEAPKKQRDVSRSLHPITSAMSSFVLTDPSHFRINNNEITRTDVGQEEDDDRYSTDSSAFLTDIFTNGVISVEVTLLSLDDDDGDLYFGLMDSDNPIPEFGETLGLDVESLNFSFLIFSDSVSLSSNGLLNYNTPSSKAVRTCHDDLNEGDCVRMEVDLDSTPRTLQFFVNGEAGERYMSGIPSSVRIGFSVNGCGTSFRIDYIPRLTQPTPISDEMEEVEW
ncbi:hypothetical protein BLNAU_7694 [Blattamonas nauphoetae]|uniref:SPRY domain-containing protein n=1 Tax=Blattamonas nauphoetae TaxID=2049346 RepID=A0ABQ9Y0P3_9EUKA|nr:hypothetical protein BLNAU_7694 [Blattamonas nauphoetae]